MLRCTGLGLLCERRGLRYATEYYCIARLFWALHNFRVVLSLGAQNAFSTLFQVCAITVWLVALGFLHIRWIVL